MKFFLFSLSNRVNVCYSLYRSLEGIMTTRKSSDDNCDITIIVHPAAREHMHKGDEDDHRT